MFEDKNNNTTALTELGEFKLIEQLTQHFKPQNKSTKKDIGDDAAILQFGEKETVVSTDMLVEGIHFNLAYVPLKHLGYKSITTAISDVYAMNAKPTQVLVSVAVSNRFPLEALEDVYAGIQIACKNYKLDLVGGDTTSSISGLILSITVIGEANKNDIVYRKGANPNDLLVVSGDLGAAYLGLQVLERENQVFKANPNAQPDLAQYEYIVGRQLKPEAGKHIVELLQALEVKPTAMIDVSDGLSSEVIHLSKQSGIGFTIYEDKMPLDPMVIKVAEEFGINPITCALNGGEDYELLFTISQDDFPKIKANPHLTVIGHATEKNAENYLVLQGSESMVPLTAQGWTAGGS